MAETPGDFVADDRPQIEGGEESRAWYIRHRWLLIVIVFFTAFACALSGQWLNIPLDAHEVFVAQTAEEMLDRGDWLVPWLNDEPRLKKPPMNYWLVMAVDWVNGGDHEITEWEARVPSALAAMLLSVVTFLLGARLFDIRTGVVAAFLLASSSGYMTYSHSARPEMVYALFCAAGLLAFMHADHCWRDLLKQKHTKWFAWLGWTCFALGMLTKGPQLQLPMLLGVIIAMLLAKRGRDILPVIRPITGIIPFILFSLWWYLSVSRAIPNATDIWFGETVSRVAERDKPAVRYIDPYYLYRTGGLVLPWVVFYFFAVVSPWSRELRANRAARMLWWVMIFPMILLWFSLNRRWYYMLPILSPVMVLMGAFCVTWADHLFSTKRFWWWRNTMIGHILALAGAAIYFGFFQENQPNTSTIVVVITAGAAIAALFASLRIHNDDRIAGSRAFLSAMLLSALLLAGAASCGSLWSTKRFSVRDSTWQIADYVSEQDAIFGWYDQWETETYYLDRAIPILENNKALVGALNEHETIWLIVDRHDAFEPPDGVDAEMIFHVDYDDEDGKQLWKLTNAAPLN